SVSADGLGLSNVGPFTGSGDQMFYHTGDILVANGGSLSSSEEIMLAGYTLIEDGGSFTASEDIINLGYLEVSSTATFGSSLDDLILSGNSYTIIDNTSTTADDIYIDHTDAQLCGAGTVEIGNGGPNPIINWFNPGTSRFDQICDGFEITCNTNCTGGSSGTGSGGFSSGITGPGGVGNSNDNSLWLRADAGTSTTTNGNPVSGWNDQSGNSNDASQATSAKQPLYQASVINGLPAIQFDDASGATVADEMLVIDNDNLDNTDGLTIFTVIRPTNLDGDERTMISKRVAVGSNQSYSMFFYTGNRLYIDVVSNNDRFSSSSSFSNSTNYISTLLYDGTLAAAQKSKIYIEESLDQTSTESSSSIPNYASDLTIGSINANDGRPFGGYIAELTIYRRALTTVERIIVNNYLSAKYNISLTANDVYTMDNTVNGDYDFEVAGIGQASDGSNHNDALGSGVLRMWDPNDLDNGEFLMWGHDNTAFNSTTTGDVDGSIIQERLSRVWGVSENSGDVGTVSISFDFSAVGNPLGSNLRLLIDRDGDGFADNDVTPVEGSVSNGIAVFSNVNLQDGDLITLGNTDASIPLPIELLEFEVFQEGENVIAKWTTVSELNNDFFTLERSTDGHNWVPINEIDGAGTTNQMKSYQTIDDQPMRGLTYYRLKQTDFDGQFSYSDVKMIEIEFIDAIKIYPNPSNGIFNVSGVDSDEIIFSVYNILGQQVPFSINEDQGIQLDVSNEPAGVYIIKVKDGNFTKTMQVIRN
ncbi:MAG: T9SS type A sorting domain-containing protein, partial [Cyclobacteriaceae bacterium]